MRLGANRFLIPPLVWTFLLALSPFESAFGKQSSQENDASRLACSSDAPIIEEGKSVVLRAWAFTPTNTAPRYIWKVDAGQITGSVPEARWDLTGVAAGPQPHRATVTVSDGSGTPANCSVEVIVTEAERGTRATARSFLVKGKKEIAGFGLYSYLLLGSRPTDSSRERYVAAIQAYLRGMEDVAKLRDYIPATKLNVTYLPIEVPAPADVTPDWLVDHYDYARARALLQILPGDLTDGPYIVSTLTPLSFESHPTQYLFQNLSTVPTKPSDLVSWWVREFLHQAAQERFWEPKTAELFVLKMRTTIAVLAIGLPDVQKGVASWVSWSH